jgi:hypothetical protein
MIVLYKLDGWLAIISFLVFQNALIHVGRLILSTVYTRV